MAIDPFAWMTIKREDRRSNPLARMHWSASFWKMFFILTVFLLLVFIAYLAGRTVEGKEIQKTVETEVDAQVSKKIEPVMEALAKIDAQQQRMIEDNEKQDRKLDKLLLQPRFAPKD